MPISCCRPRPRASKTEDPLREELAYYKTLAPHLAEEGYAIAFELGKENLKVAREEVQEFFQGKLPPGADRWSLQPLAFSWLLARSGVDTLDLSGCWLGDGGKQRVASQIKSAWNFPASAMRDWLTLRKA